MLSPKNIYISSQTFIKNVKWLSLHAETEWISMHTHPPIAILKNHFEKEQILYLVTDRHDSLLDNAEKIYEHINGLILQKDFCIWNHNFTKVIEYNKIGVYRLGER